MILVLVIRHMLNYSKILKQKFYVFSNLCLPPPPNNLSDVTNKTMVLFLKYDVFFVVVWSFTPMARK